VTWLTVLQDKQVYIILLILRWHSVT
jgi:hypothetical protein